MRGYDVIFLRFCAEIQNQRFVSNLGHRGMMTPCYLFDLICIAYVIPDFSLV